VSDKKQISKIDSGFGARLIASPWLVFAFLLLTIAGSIWFVAERAARQTVTDRMLSGSSTAAKSVPFLLETGQNLIQQLAEDPELIRSGGAELNQLLEQELNSVPYFEQYFLLSPSGESIAGYPIESFEGVESGAAEQQAVERAGGGVALQVVSIPAEDVGGGGQLSFIARAGDAGVVVIGRSQLAVNPFAQSILDYLQSLAQSGGQGFLLDASGQSVYWTGGGDEFGGTSFNDRTIYEDDTNNLVLYEPALGSEWVIVSQMPLTLVQKLALEIAWPAFGLMGVLALLAYIFWTRSSSVLAGLSFSLPGKNRELVDKHESVVAGKSADGMSQIFTTKLAEIHQLLSAGSKTSGSMDTRMQIDPVLEAAMLSGAEMARLVFDDGEAARGEQAFGKGRGHQAYQALDSQVLALLSKREQVLLSNPVRARLEFGDLAIPHKLIAFALKHQGEKLGVMWLSFAENIANEKESLDYLQSLADQLAASTQSWRRYFQAEEGRQLYGAMLDSLPEAALLLNETGALLQANLAARRLLKIKGNSWMGADIQNVVKQEELLSFLLEADEDSSVKELEFGRGRSFAVRLSKVELDSGWRGWACVLREVTESRRAETKRTELLETTSDQLLDPLELVGGYLTMLEMVGDLNEKQEEYLSKTKQSLGGMSTLVNSLLDIERIESEQGLQVDLFSFAKAVDEVIVEIKPRAVQKQVKIEVVASDNAMPNISADRTLLKRALYNLLDNGIRNSSRGDKVEVSLSRQSDEVLIAVKDAGAGIAQLDQGKIFDRLEGEAGRGGGLAIVKSIFERHNGRVWVESQLGAGSTFYGELPVKQALT
jgi:signal transduction histidine kinase